MSPAFLILLALGLGLIAWLAARARAWSFKRSNPGTRLAALPSYHGWYVAFWVVLPMLAFAALWSAVQPMLVEQSVLANPAAADLPGFALERQTMLAEARAVATGAAPAVFNPDAQRLVTPYREALGRFNLIGLIAALVIAFAGVAWAFLRLRPDFRARTKVERTVCLLYTSPSPRDKRQSRMPSSA